MVICKFFLQGTCKYGDYCRFEHQVPTTYTSFSDPPASILRQSNFEASQHTNTNTSTKNQNVDTNTLVKSVVNDMISAEKGGQWLLSCYAPFKEKPAFPGFSDQSFEEVRLGYYEAVKSGTIEQYKIQLQAMLQDVMMKVKALQNPSSDIINILKNIYNTPVSSTKGNVFNNTTSNFQKPTPVFGSQQPSGSSIFATANQNLFGSTPASTTNNIFGSTASSNSIFGAPAHNKSIFGAQTQPNTQTNAFGNQPTNKSLFAQNNSVFGTQSTPNQSVFGSQHQNASQSIFGQQKSQSVFGIPPQQSSQSMDMVHQPQPNTGQSIFAAPNQSGQSVFGTQQNPNVQPPFQLQSQHSPNSIFAASNPVATLAQQNIFGNPIPLIPNMNTITNPLTTQPIQNAIVTSSQQNPLVHQHTASIFGAPQIPQTVGAFNTPQPQQGSVFAQPNPSQQNSNSIFGGGGINLQATMVDGSLYSKLEELTDEEKNWFVSDDLDIYSIPEKPPTYEMCFKT